MNEQSGDILQLLPTNDHENINDLYNYYLNYQQYDDVNSTKLKDSPSSISENKRGGNEQNSLPPDRHQSIAGPSIGPAFTENGTSYLVDFNLDYSINNNSSYLSSNMEQQFNPFRQVIPDNLYPAWCEKNHMPISTEEIRSIFIDLTYKFGFQKESMNNMFDHLMTQLDSRASRMFAPKALDSLHADYIGGKNANYKKWYLAARIDIDDQTGFGKIPLNRSFQKIKRILKKDDKKNNSLDYSLETAESNWLMKMKNMKDNEKVEQLALYFLIWGEANQIRFVPECLCFIFKCANDYYNSTECKNSTNIVKNGAYLEDVITPLYKFLRNQRYKLVKGKYIQRNSDHNKVIGYDDVNQLFWYPEGIKRIILDDNSHLIDKPLESRYNHLKSAVWSKVFFKTYRETRTWFHLVTNFNRIWIIHITIFWFYTAFNSPTLYTEEYHQLLNNEPSLHARWSSVSLGGTIAVIIELIALLSESWFVPRNWPGAQSIIGRLFLLLGLLTVNIAPSIFIFMKFPLDIYSKTAAIIAGIQFAIAICTCLYLSITPLGALMGSYLDKNTRRYIPSKNFTASFPSISFHNRVISIAFWIIVFVAKLTESYFFLTLSIRDPIRDLSIMKMTRCHGEQYLGNILCQIQPLILLGLMYFTDLILFFLDTYLWYVMCSCILSIALSFRNGISLFTPWRKVFSQLPDRIYHKLLVSSDVTPITKTRYVSQIWNSIIISLYREHFLTIEQAGKLMYHDITSQLENAIAIRGPSFFISQDDRHSSSDFYSHNSEAERRLSFFSQSLACKIQEPLAIDCMPTFTVMIPHYKETIMFSIKELLKEDSTNGDMTLLEYLKRLFPLEWKAFVKETNFLLNEPDIDDEDSTDSEVEVDDPSSKIFTFDDFKEIPKLRHCSKDLNRMIFKSSSAENILRTRIWASTRSQTLYRTISGFMNYQRALKLLYHVENSDIMNMFSNNSESLDKELNQMASRKFKMLVSMQRLNDFSIEEYKSTEFLLRAFPQLQIAYLEVEKEETDDNYSTNKNYDEEESKKYFAVLIDGSCKITKKGKRRPRYRVQLSGNPIIGDGKSDNQNMALQFYRGEYIQVIDANQDNYLEECLKIRSVLAEFEELNVPNDLDPYYEGTTSKAPVAFVGAREFIFSEEAGILGDVAAGKEKTFGTLFARTMATVSGKLHYGHPDFLNAIFMTTRGGISKAQKGLHLNEDIYAGMNALCRGGRIKHCDFYQCGKGRDLGFDSILNFTSKIGAGMGEQMLSREYFYLGTQLPLDRFLSFYYAHPGFHINNLFIMISMEMFMLILINLGSMVHESILCDFKMEDEITKLMLPIGCYNLVPVLHWVKIFILSIFIVFFISFSPLLVEEFTENGLIKSLTRFGHHFLSLSPFFEVFVCQIYAQALFCDISLGGARYIGTGRGYAIERNTFHHLYSTYTPTAIYDGVRSGLMLLFGCVTIWQPALLWIWVTVTSLCISPFLFNPHQFEWKRFFIDYGDFICWLSRGNDKVARSSNSWISHVSNTRTKITGSKKRQLKAVQHEAGSISGYIRPHLTNSLFTALGLPLINACACFCAFSFINAQNGVREVNNNKVIPANTVMRLIICALIPIVIDGVILIFLGLGSLLLVPFAGRKMANTVAFIAHGMAVINHIASIELLWYFEGWNKTRGLLGLISVLSIQRLIYSVLSAFLLTREYRGDAVNVAWWTGDWRLVGWSGIGQPFREFLCKLEEMNMFAVDFILGNFLLFVQLPLVCIPWIDWIHFWVLFWLKPKRTKNLRRVKAEKRRPNNRKKLVRSIILYFITFAFFILLFVGPLLAGSMIPDIHSYSSIPSLIGVGLIQPTSQDNNDTGPNAPSTIVTQTPTLTI